MKTKSRSKARRKKRPKFKVGKSNEGRTFDISTLSTFHPYPKDSVFLSTSFGNKREAYDAGYQQGLDKGREQGQKYGIELGIKQNQNTLLAKRAEMGIELLKQVGQTIQAAGFAFDNMPR